MTKLEQARAFLLSNGLSFASIVPTLLLIRRQRPPGLLALYLCALFRLGFLASVLEYFTRSRRDRPKTTSGSEEETRNALWGLFCVTAPLEAIMMGVGLARFTKPHNNYSWLLFIPRTFVFELVFDFGHYWAHRLVHSQPWLYKLSGHKTHHQVVHPTPFSTFHQELVDSLLSNVLPYFTALAVLDRGLGICFTPNQLLLALGLKTYVEVAGHVGVLDSRATSFPQCVWLPRTLGIALQTKDHDLHHTHGGRSNFAKRFTLFDKLFGTYAQV
ncbi:hypothetical protein BASA81_006619 [Batrachochytrium salamandrivorans]|nr:hypothetical protein BASA81_006619 [Batrachochytrium salamandrivorans]